MDLQSHLVDGALDLFGPVRSVYAELEALTTVGDDVAFLALRHLSGVVSHLGATSLAGAPGPRTRLLGREAAYLVGDVDGDPSAFDAWRDADDEHRGFLVRGTESEPVPRAPGGGRTSTRASVRRWSRGSGCRSTRRRRPPSSRSSTRRGCPPATA